MTRILNTAWLSRQPVPPEPADADQLRRKSTDSFLLRGWDSETETERKFRRPSILPERGGWNHKFEE